ncbi:hypothetical protein [Microbulbifer sp. JTAC008]|uniref:hypothetical protein n=2 Tax=unclassified Microbulbifer TaxID=2619833 RepID=UPI00403A18FD
MGIFFVILFVGGLLAVPYLAIKLTMLEQDESSQWSTFWRLASADYYTMQSVAAIPVTGLSCYISFYRGVSTGSFEFIVIAFGLAVLILFLIEDLLRQDYLQFHIKNLKLLSISVISLTLIALELSMAATTFIGAIAILWVSVRCVKQQVLSNRDKTESGTLDGDR